MMIIASLIAFTLSNCHIIKEMEPAVEPNAEEGTFQMPAEEARHEGTWLQWPHDYTYRNHSIRHDETFIAIAKALHIGEKVHIIVYNEEEENRVKNLLMAAAVDMQQIDFFQWKTDDYWVRDNGPIFVYDESGHMAIQDWGFNGWGDKAPFDHCNLIPEKVGQQLNMTTVKVPMINEGGSVEIDGRGTLLAKRSSILNSNRNPGLTQTQAEKYFRQYLGVTNFIWLEGYAGEEITDDHIDGTARFANHNTIVTYLERDSDPDEYAILKNARDVEGEKYNLVHLPLTKYKLPSSRDYGIYINFYVGNEVVLVPNFEDPNDVIANATLQEIFLNRQVVGIPAIELGLDGGRRPLRHPTAAYGSVNSKASFYDLQMDLNLNSFIVPSLTVFWICPF